MFTGTLFVSFFALVTCYDQSTTYMNKLLVQANGTETETVEWPGQKHGFVSEGRRSQRNQQTLKYYQLYSADFNMPFDDVSSGLQWYINADQENHYNVKDVWRINYTGAGIVVAVVDDGLNTTHPELRKNYDRNASHDFVDGDDNPEPWPNETHIITGHGTKCAGVIAAEAGNKKRCGVGLAYNARIGGIRLFKTKMATDEAEAKALKFNRDYIDIYSNSWGPDDKGFEVKGPENATEYALKEGAEKGRHGKGSIFVFASGNGGVLSKDSCAYNGYVNSIYTIAIAAVRRDGSVPSYGERCPGIMATAYSKDTFGDRNPVVTAGKKGNCEFYFGGTSAATAMASGLIALTLEANHNLTWRDLQHIIVRSARFTGLNPPPKNGAGLRVSNYMGFGLMDALKMVNLAKRWKTVPEQRRCEIFRSVDRFRTKDQIDLSTWPTECRERISFLEHVQVRVNIKVWPRGDLILTLQSPNGTLSRLTQHRPYDRLRGISTDLADWVILTLHHWGENPRGIWKLSAELRNGFRGNRELRLFNWTLILYGTASDPLDGNGHVHNPAVHVVSKQRKSNKTGYIVQIKTDRRYPPLRNDAKIQLFGVNGKTHQHKLAHSGKAPNGRSSQLFYIRDHPVGKLINVAIIQKVEYRRSSYRWKLNEVAVRQEGNKTWVVWPYNREISSSVEVVKITQGCKDKNDRCSIMARNGYCRRGAVAYMRKNCKKSCNFCDGNDDSRSGSTGNGGIHGGGVVSGCKDNEDHCSVIAENGYCLQGDVAYMRRNCKKSCNFCDGSDDSRSGGAGDGDSQGGGNSSHVGGRSDCKDKKTSCIGWVRNGFCSHYPNFMKRNCPKSCKFCVGGSGRNGHGRKDECEDKLKSCPAWAVRGYCRHSYVVQMTKYCKKSCNLCGDSSGGGGGSSVSGGGVGGGSHSPGVGR